MRKSNNIRYTYPADSIMAHANNLDGWQPMSESYHDPEFNSYDHGPGVNLTPFASTPETEYKLYVCNIPSELTEKGVRQIFNTYGKTLHVLSPLNSDWAYVTYPTFQEAELAIRMLNNKSPLRLKVQFANKDKYTAQRSAAQHRIPQMRRSNDHFAGMEHQRRDYINPDDRPPVPGPLVGGVGRGIDLAASARRAIPVPDADPYNQQDDPLYPVTSDPNIYNAYNDGIPFADTNNLWARNRLKISKDGTRYVSYGRGFTCYELPPRHPNVSQQIRAVYEKREAGLYRYGENKVAAEIGKCQHCTKPATKRCQLCQEFYCSRACQEIDWPRHRIECQPMPDLEEPFTAFSLSASSGEEATSQKSAVQKPRRLRRPYKAEVAVPNSSSTLLQGTCPKAETSVTLESQPEPDGKEKIQLSSESKCESINSGNQKRVSNQYSERSNNAKKPSSISDDQNLRNANKQTEVMNGTQRSNSSMELLKQKSRAKQNAAVGPSHHQVETQDGNHMNRKLFDRGGDDKSESNWEQIIARVKNLKMNTTNTKPRPLFEDPDVSFHRASDLPGPSRVKSTPSVSFANAHTAVRASANGKVAAGVCNNVNEQTPVQVVRVSPSACEEKVKNIVEMLDNEEEGCFEVHVLLGGNKAAVTVCVLKVQEEYAKIASALKPACELMPANANFEPKVGDFVCGKRLDDWIRGTVVSLGPPIRLAAVDEGRVESVTAVKPVPEGFSDLPMLGAVCEYIGGDFKLEHMVQYTFVVTNINKNNSINDGIEITVFSPDEKEGKAIFRPWTPAPEQKGTPYAILKTNTEVCLVSFRSHTRLFARSLLPTELETFNRVTQEVAKWSTKVSRLTEPPVLGEMVLAKYVEDGNFYRAIVRKIKEKNITVSYLDFGNIETTRIDNLRPISNQLKEYPSCVANIVLKNVPADVPMNKEVNEYLGMLAGLEKPLMCTFEGSPIKQGVELKCADGTSVNKKIVELLTPSWKKEEDKTSVFMLKDLEVAELGAVGTSASILVLFAYGPLMYAMAPHDLELIGHITDVMASQMAEYCAQTKEHYIPRQDELCLAPFDGMWYRAVCMEPSTTPTTSTVNYIDFGNIAEVPHTNLRLITKDFMSTNAMANICEVVGLGPVNEDGDLPPAIAERVAQLVPLNDVVTIKIVKRTKPGEYIIELPNVREILIQEGLLKP